MNKKVIFSLTFVAGVALGAFGSRQYFKTKYEKLYEEERDSVREAYAKRLEEIKKDCEKVDEAGKKIEELVKEEKGQPRRVKYARVGEDAKKANKIIEENDYIPEGQVAGPYVITPEEFDTIDEYDTITLLYFADGVLTDDDNEPVEDVEGEVGLESLNHFGEFEDDTVFVRNDIRRCDYEILMDYRNYADVIQHSPRPVEVR